MHTMLKRLFICLSFVVITSSCSDGSDPLRFLLATPERVIVTVETKQTVIVLQTSTPIPTPTLPAYFGSPIVVEPQLENVVRASLIALGDRFTIKTFAEDREGDPIVWIEDRQFPNTLFCSAPLYIENVGSVMVLTTSNLYGRFKSEGIVEGQSGCIVVKLDQGREQIEKLLISEHGIYDALVNGRKFSTSSEVNSYVDTYLAKHKDQPFPFELQVVLVVLTGNDLGHTSVDIECQRNMSGGCVNAYTYMFTGTELSLEGSDIKHVPLVYAEYMDFSEIGDRFLFSERGRQLIDNAPAGSVIQTNPYTPDEAIRYQIGNENWRHFLLYSARIAGLGRIAPNYDGTMSPTNGYLSKLNSYTGVPIVPLNVSKADWQMYTEYFKGESNKYPFRAVEQLMQFGRKTALDSYLQFLVLEQP